MKEEKKMLQRKLEKQKLIAPTNYELISEDEAKIIIGGITVEAVVGIIAGVIAAGVTAGTAIHQIGRVAGERVFYSGYPNSEYQKHKWAIRAGVIGANPLIGALVMTGFENRYYELVNQRGW